jgi:hypothetical protein
MSSKYQTNLRIFFNSQMTVAASLFKEYKGPFVTDIKRRTLGIG